MESPEKSMTMDTAIQIQAMSCRFGAIEVTIEVGSVVQDLDVSFGRRPPFDEVHQGGRVSSQGVAVGFYSIKHDRRNREHHARWRELSFGQNVMNEAAVETTVAVL